MNQPYYPPISPFPPGRESSQAQARALSGAERENLRNRFALRISRALSDQADSIPHDIAERLRVAREQAVVRAGTAARAAAAGRPVVVGRSGGAAVLGAQPGWWFWLASIAPVVGLVVGLFVIGQLHDQQKSAVTAEIDSALLADDLPPDAYADAGFVQFLKGADSL